MDYLYRMYYKNSKDFIKEWSERFNCPTSFKTGLTIMTDEGTEEELFYIPNMYTFNLMSKALENDTQITKITKGLPNKIIEILFFDVLIAELQASFEIEGVFITREEIASLIKDYHGGKKVGDRKYGKIVEAYASLWNDDSPFSISVEDLDGIYDEFTYKEDVNQAYVNGSMYRTTDTIKSYTTNINLSCIHYEDIFGEDNIKRKIDQLSAFMFNDQINPIHIIISYFYFGYIYPFNMANGRISRYVYTYYLKEILSIFSALSFSKGARLLNRDYYDSFNRTTSKISKGEMNYYVDTFLEMFLLGQGATIANLKDRVKGYCRMKNRLAGEKRANTEFKKKVLLVLNLCDFFIPEGTYEREELFDKFKDIFPVSSMRHELDELERAGYIKRVKARPIVYAVRNRLY